MTIGERLKEARLSNKLTMSDVEKITNITKGNISSFENNRFKPSAEPLVLLSKLYNVSIDWILTGNDFIPIPSILDNSIASKFDSLTKDNKLKIEGMIELKLLEQEQEQGDRQKDIPDTFVEEKIIPFESYIKEETSQSFNYQVPYRGQIAAGAPLHRFSDLFDEEPQLIPSDFPAQYAWRIAGQSMEPLIKDGDMIFTRFIEKNNLQDGDIVVVRTNDGYNCKRIYHFPKKKLVILKSENPDKEQYPDQEYYYGDGVDTIHQIEGKVIF